MKELFEQEYSKIDLAACQDCQHDDVTLDDFVRTHGGGPATSATVAVWTRVMLGCEPSELSAAYFFVYCKSQGGLMKMRSGKVQGRYLTIKKGVAIPGIQFRSSLTTVNAGTQSIAEGLATSLPVAAVRLGTAVKSIKQTKAGVEVCSTDGHVFRARKAIVALSTPLYRKISFEPSLPAGKALLADSNRLGYYTKVIAVYSRPWWRDSGLSGASQSFLGPAAATRDTSDDSRRMFRLTSFIAGQTGEKWSLQDASARRSTILGQLSHMFGSDDAQSPTEYIEQQWSSEEWSLGCPCPYMPPGVLTRLGQYLTQPHGHVHFVGTETAVEWKGYMEGALTSGIRGADEVVKQLRHECI